MREGAAKKEEKPRKFQAIRGTRDILPPETALWNRVEQTAHEVFATYGFGEVCPPIFESTELFARSIGADTDVVLKEMYTFSDKAATNLSSIRDSITGKLPFRDKRAAGFLAIMASVFALYMEEAWEEGTIPRTDSGRSVVEGLRKEIEVAKRLELIDGLTSQDEEFQRLRMHLRMLLDHVDLGGEALSLRPEATASVCRAYIEHGMQALPQPVKLYCIGPMFRRERPQKGRYRQFYQIDAEVLGGSDASAIDAEVIEMVMTFFERVGLEGAQLDINSIGDKKCRPRYVELLRTELRKVKDQLGEDSKRRIETNPLRVLDSKVKEEQSIIEKLPRIVDHLCKDCAEHYAAVKRELHLRDVKYHENWRLVRGLDYYMRTTFEITAKGLGSQNAVCGGGRYDGLVELLGGPPTKGIGFAIGEDRLILSLQEARKEVASGEWRVASGKIGCDVYVAWMGQKAYATAIRAAKDLRAAGFSVELPPVEQKFGKALGQADKLGARYALILGDNEVSSGEWTLKTLATGEQQKLSEPDLLNFLKREKPKADP